MIDPRVHGPEATTSAGFPMQFSSDADYFLTQDGANGWGSSGYTGHIFFTVRLALPLPYTIVTPIAPVFATSSQCDVPGTVDLPTQTGIEFDGVAHGTEVTVTATALSGYAFPIGAETSWTFETAAAPCPVVPIAVTPEAPEFTPAACDVAGVLTPAKTAGITYVVTGPASNTVMTATALNGYALAPGAQTTWSYDLRALSCEKPATENPAAKTQVPPATQVQARPELARTGAELTVWPFLSLALVVIGAGALLTGRRTRCG